MIGITSIAVRVWKNAGSPGASGFCLCGDSRIVMDSVYLDFLFPSKFLLL